jgi:hypothetical protein
MVFLCGLFFDGQVLAAGFTDNGNGTVTDNDLGLMWQQRDDGTKKTWETALSYCEGLSLTQYDDWRVPNKRELMSIVDYARSGPPAISTTYFPGTASEGYWVSTTSANDSASAWYVDFGYGNVTKINKSQDNYVRCVRK